MNTKLDDKSREKSVIESLDNNLEIISFLKGGCDYYTNKTGFIYKKPIEIYPGDYALYIKGFRHSSGIFDFYFDILAENYVKVSCFIGVVIEISPIAYYVRGIALDDIEWY